MDVVTYHKNNIPENLAIIPVKQPGNRGQT